MKNASFFRSNAFETAAATANTNSTTSTRESPAAVLDWPSPSLTFEALARRPSWQEPSLSPTSSSSSSAGSSRSSIGCGGLQPAIVLSAESGAVSFRSPFASSNSGSPPSRAIQVPASSSTSLESEVSPFSAWPSSSRRSSASTAPCSPGGLYSPSPSTATTMSSPGVQTPGASSVNGSIDNHGSLSPYSKSMFLPPFDAAFKKRLSGQQQLQQSGEPTSPSPFSHRVCSPRSPGAMLSNFNFQLHQLPATPAAGGGDAGLLQPNCESPSARDLRRRSVDVGMLGNARGHQASGRAVQQDAPAAAFVPPEQLRVRRAQRTSKLQTNESL